MYFTLWPLRQCIRGQSIKKPNTFFKFIVLLTTWSNLFPSKCSPSTLDTPRPTFFPVLERVLERVLRDGAKVPYWILRILCSVNKLFYLWNISGFLYNYFYLDTIRNTNNSGNSCTVYTSPGHPYNMSLTYLLTHSIQQSPSWEANWFCS